jgi:CubicO group peptidase (beta-lactamase class C family)
MRILRTTAQQITLILLVTLSLAAAAIPTVNPQEAGLSAERLKRIDEMIQRRIDAGEMAGAVAVVGRHGKVAHLAAVGQMDRESNQPMKPDTIFRIASMTKPVVGVAVMMMVEEGKVRLSDPVSRYIPEFKGMKVAVAIPDDNPQGQASGSSGQPNNQPPPHYTMPAEREITVRDLLTHTSGLASGPISSAAMRDLNRRPDENLKSFIPRLGSTPLEFQPGSRWSYSPQAGFDVLGRIVEITSGLPLDQFFRQRIFTPLGMESTSFWPSDAQWPRVASVYNRTQTETAKGGEKGLEKIENSNWMSSKVYFMGAGGLMSTAEDYLSFGLMLANGGELNGKRLLSPKTVEMMRAVHIPDTLPGRAAGEGYGLSMRVVSDHAARGTLLSDGSFGWSGYFGTHFFVDPEEGVVGVFMVQTSNGEVNRDFETMVMQAIVD